MVRTLAAWVLASLLFGFGAATPALAADPNPQNFTREEELDILAFCRPLMATVRRKQSAGNIVPQTDEAQGRTSFSQAHNFKFYSLSDLTNKIRPSFADPRYAAGYWYEYDICTIDRRIWQLSGHRMGPGAAPPPAPAAAPTPPARTPPPSAVADTSLNGPVPSLVLPGLPAPGTPGAKPVYPIHAAMAEGDAALDDALDDYREAQADGRTWKPPEFNEGEDATSCLILKSPVDPRDFVRLVNTCSYRIEGMWCVVGHDCKPSYTNMHTFDPGASYPIYGTEGHNERTVQWAACKGRNTIGGSNEGFFHSCSKELSP